MSILERKLRQGMLQGYGLPSYASGRPMGIILKLSKQLRSGMDGLKDGDFGVEDRQHSGQPKKFEDVKLGALLSEDVLWTLALGVEFSTVVNDQFHSEKPTN